MRIFDKKLFLNTQSLPKSTINCKLLYIFVTLHGQVKNINRFMIKLLWLIDYENDLRITTRFLDVF
jgi:hypothetical protein